MASRDRYRDYADAIGLTRRVDHSWHVGPSSPPPPYGSSTQHYQAVMCDGPFGQAVHCLYVTPPHKYTVEEVFDSDSDSEPGPFSGKACKRLFKRMPSRKASTSTSVPDSASVMRPAATGPHITHAMRSERKTSTEDEDLARALSESLRVSRRERAKHVRRHLKEENKLLKEEIRAMTERVKHNELKARRAELKAQLATHESESEDEDGESLPWWVAEDPDL